MSSESAFHDTRHNRHAQLSTRCLFSSHAKRANSPDKKSRWDVFSAWPMAPSPVGSLRKRERERDWPRTILEPGSLRRTAPRPSLYIPRTSRLDLGPSHAPPTPRGSPSTHPAWIRRNSAQTFGRKSLKLHYACMLFELILIKNFIIYRDTSEYLPRLFFIEKIEFKISLKSMLNFTQRWHRIILIWKSKIVIPIFIDKDLIFLKHFINRLIIDFESTLVWLYQKDAYFFSFNTQYNHSALYKTSLHFRYTSHARACVSFYACDTFLIIACNLRLHIARSYSISDRGTRAPALQSH